MGVEAMKKRLLQSKRNEFLQLIALPISTLYDQLTTTIIKLNIGPDTLRVSSPAILDTIKAQIAELVAMQKQLVILQQLVKNDSLIFWPGLLKGIIPASKCYSTAEEIIHWLQNYHIHTPNIVRNTIFFEYISTPIKKVCNIAELHLHTGSKNIIVANLESLILKVYKSYVTNPLRNQELDELLTELLDHKHGLIVVLKYILEEEYERLGGMDRSRRFRG
jgi:hypothetical protein